MGDLRSIRKIKRAEPIFKEGDKAESVFIVQSGKVSLFHSRGGNRLEIMQTSKGQVLGELNVLGTKNRTISAEALSEVTLLEIPISEVMTDLGKSSDLIKILFKSYHEKFRSLSGDVRNIKMEKEQLPCPAINIPRIFSVLNLISRHVGEQKDGELVVLWSSLAMSGVRLFLESATRLHSAAEILVKLGYARMIMSKNEEGVEELHQLAIKDIQFIEDFAEFYQYNLYKGARSEAIAVDPLALKLSLALADLAKNSELDRKGVASFVFASVVEDLKKNYGLNFKSSHIDLLEKKGLFMKKRTLDEGVQISFEVAEFQKVSAFWAIIREIDKWNERGRVEMVEKEDDDAKAAEAELCPGCQTPVGENMKFCSNCGHKLVA